MKKNAIYFLNVLVVLVLVVGTLACKKDDNSGSEPEYDKITLQVDGANYEPFLIQHVDIGYGLTVVGSFSDGKNSLVIILESDITEGDHDLSNHELSYGVFWDKVIDLNSGNIERYTSASGNIFVEEYNEETGKLKGTFHATCTTSDNKTVSITNGTFVVYL